MEVLKGLKTSDKFIGKVKLNNDNSNVTTGEFKVIENTEKYIKIKTPTGVIVKVPHNKVTFEKFPPKKSKEKDGEEGKGKGEDGENEKKEAKKTESGQGEGANKKVKVDFKIETLNNIFVDEETILNTIQAGIKNLWLVGPAGCGKTVMSENVAKRLKRESFVISCGLGTSATEFLGYKYPSRESTKFADFYEKASVIILDEFTALDPSVAQVANSALANGFVNTTTGIKRRHEDCIIIATSNTFGQGANRQYVSNNQLDASTIDRFVGGILEVDYSIEYESQFDNDVVNYIWLLRDVIKKNALRRIASTRMIINGCNIKKHFPTDWRERLILNWSPNELNMLQRYIEPDTNEVNIDFEEITDTVGLREIRKDT